MARGGPDFREGYPCTKCGALVPPGKTALELHEGWHHVILGMHGEIEELQRDVNSLKPEPCHNFNNIVGLPVSSTAKVRCEKCGEAAIFTTNIGQTHRMWESGPSDA